MPGANNAPWWYDIDWGDGFSSHGSTSSQSDEISPWHLYVLPGTYGVRVTVTDKDGGAGADQLALTVTLTPESSRGAAGAVFSPACRDPVTASCKTSKRSTAKRTIVPRPPATRPAWRTSTPPTSASSSCSRCCWTSATRSRLEPRPAAKPAATRQRARTRSPRSKPFIASRNSVEDPLLTRKSRSPAAAGLCLFLAACGGKADLVVTDGVLWTGLSHGAPRPGTVAIARGKIVAVGDSAAVARYLGPRTTIVRARGGFVMPGFTDGHTHFIDGGFQLASVDLRDAGTPAEFIRRIQAYAKTLRSEERSEERRVGKECRS